MDWVRRSDPSSVTKWHRRRNPTHVSASCGTWLGPIAETASRPHPEDRCKRCAHLHDPPSPSQTVSVIARDFYCEGCEGTATVTCMTEHHVRTK